MDTRNYCAYNLSKDAFLSLKVTIADAALEPLRVLEVFVDELGVDSESALWLTPLTTSPQLPRLFPFDIAYLDRDNRIVEALSVVPGAALPPFRSQFASALVLPERTLATRQTHPCDQLRICNDEDMAAQLKSNSAAPIADPFPEGKDAPLFPSSRPRVLLEPIPIEVTRNVESPYELFPSPLVFMPAADAQGSRSAELALLEPPPRPQAPPVELPVAVAEAPVELTQESTVSAAAIAAPAQGTATPVEVSVEAPVQTTPVSASPIAAQFIAVSEESAQRPAIALRATPIPPSRSVQTTRSLATGWQITTSETAVPVRDHAHISEAKKRPSAPATQPQANAGPQPPVEQPPIQAVWIPSQSVSDVHGEKQTEQFETASISNPSDSTLASQPTDPLTNLPTSREVETSAPARKKSVVRKFLRKRPAYPLHTEISQPADFSRTAQQSSPVSGPGAPVAPGAESAPDEPRFFVPSRVRFFDPASDTSDEKITTTPETGDLKAEDFKTRSSTQLPPELRALIQRITEKEKEKQRGTAKKSKVIPIKIAPEPAQPVSRIAEPEREVPAPAKTKPAPQQAERTAEQKHTFAERMLRWLDESGKHHRRAPRTTSPGLVAFYWSGGSPKPHQVVDISDTGFYLLTEELWTPQTMLRVTLQRPDKEEGNPRHSITVLARVVRIGPNGVGHQFVMTESLKRKSLDLLPEKGTDAKALKRFLQPIQ
jgi:hypothetical protein